MKKTITTVLLVFAISSLVHAQTDPKTTEAKVGDPATNCYLKWAQKFEARGADDVADGIYTDVIITVRNGSEAECYNGKCEVKEGKIVGMYRKLEDGTFELLKNKLRYEFPITITNGMSKTVVTYEDELINVLFIKKIKAKKAGFVKAAEPTDD
ncbi:MAG TPA: hypothetical protein VFF27_16910 [Bacteroidia bacterium]|jgi:hypothetical protein|nr:hypothetical protein [Bacteroidia bacterium]